MNIIRSKIQMCEYKYTVLQIYGGFRYEYRRKVRIDRS